MTYTPKYVTLKYIEGLLGNESFSADTVPDRDDVYRYIEEVETEIDYEKLWGSVRVVDELIDIDVRNRPPLNMLATNAFMYFRANATIVTPKYPSFTEVIKCEVNTAGATETPTWSERTAWPASGSDFEILQQQIYGKQVGYALRFLQNAPSTGANRVKLTYMVGLDLPDAVLREYVGSKVAARVMEILAQYNKEVDLERGRDAARYRITQRSVERIEKKLPTVNRDVAIIV